jgi:hypothetical protein
MTTRMRRENIDHILRAAAGVTGQNKFVLVGSAAVILRLKHVPLEMMYTPEIDIYAPDAEDVEVVSELIDGSIGQGSRFHSNFGYYGDGVSPATAKMPADWMSRAIGYRPPGETALVAIVPDIDDIGLAKLVAWREKDQTWLRTAANANVISLQRMVERLKTMPAPNSDGYPPSHEILADRLRSLAARARTEIAIPPNRDS